MRQNRMLGFSMQVLNHKARPMGTLVCLVVSLFAIGSMPKAIGWMGSAPAFPSSPASLPMTNEFAISNTTFTGFRPSVAYNSNHDEYLVVWDNASDIYGRRVSSRGELIGNDFVIAAAPNSESSPDVAYDPNTDQYLVIWNREYSSNNRDIYGRMISYDGPSSLLSEFYIDTDAVDSISPKVAYALAQGEFLVVWEDAPPSPGLSTIHGRRVTNVGMIINTRYTIASHATQHRANPNVTYSLARNEYLVVYDDLETNPWNPINESVYAVRLAGDLTKLGGGEFIIANGVDDEVMPAVAACNAADQYLVAFQAIHQPPFNPAMYIRYVNGDGIPDGNIYKIDDSSASYPNGKVDITCRWGTQYLVTWEHWNASTTTIGIFGQLWYDNETANASFEIANPTPYQDEQPSVVGGATSPNFLVAWQQDDGSGYSDVYGRILGDTKPKADFSFTPSSGDTNTTFQFDASSSNDYEDSTSLLQVRWDWENDGTYDTSWSTTKTADHKFSTDGTYSVKLEVQDTYGNTNTTTKQVVVNNTPPTAAFTVDPTIGDATTLFTFDASGCKDNEDPASALQVRWDWFNDGTWDTFWDTNKAVGVTFGGATYGQLYVKLEVKDTDGLIGSTTGSVMIDNAPMAAFTVTPTSGDTNTVFQFDASSSSDPDADIYSLQVRWDWTNDGTYDTSWSYTKTITHTYSIAGTYTVKLQVRQFAGSLTDTVTKKITVSAAPPNTTNISVYLPVLMKNSPR